MVYNLIFSFLQFSSILIEYLLEDSYMLIKVSGYTFDFIYRGLF